MAYYYNVLNYIIVICCIGSCCARPIPCYIFDHITLLIILPAIPMIESQNKKTTVAPAIPKSTMRVHAFEEVEWVIHPQAYKERTDCHGHYIRCIRFTTPIIPVCGFNMRNKWYEDYYSICEIDLENCLYRLKYKPLFGIYGGEWYDNIVFYNGDAHECQYYTRRSNSPEELDLMYFGRDRAEVLAEWNKKNERYFQSNVEMKEEY